MIGVKKKDQQIIKQRQPAVKALPTMPTPYRIYVLLIVFISAMIAGCGTEPASNSLTTSSIPPVLPSPTVLPSPISSDQLTIATISPLTLPVVMPTATAPMRQRLTLLPTATPTLSMATAQLTVIPTLPMTTPLPTIIPSIPPTPTLSLLEVLNQTVVVTTTAALSPTATITHPEPPLVDQPALGPEMTSAPMWQPLSVTTLTTLQPDGIVRTIRIPILMYHYLSTPPSTADIYRKDLSVPPELFAAHLDRLQAEGYTTISLYDLVAHLQQGASLPEHPVILTFDDGYRDNYENAFPLLHERQMMATFFLVIDFINNERPEYLTWDMVRAMYAGGMSIEVHGLDHSSLRKRSRADLEFQALRSYETIQDRIGIRPRFLSYPAGEYDADTIEMVQSAGYWAALTTIQGATHSNDKLFELHRVRIRNTTTADELVRLIKLDW